MIKNCGCLRGSKQSQSDYRCTKRGFEIYDHLISFDVEVWDYRK